MADLISISWKRITEVQSLSRNWYLHVSDKLIHSSLDALVNWEPQNGRVRYKKGKPDVPSKNQICLDQGRLTIFVFNSRGKLGKWTMTEFQRLTEPFLQISFHPRFSSISLAVRLSKYLATDLIWTMINDCVSQSSRLAHTRLQKAQWVHEVIYSNLFIRWSEPRTIRFISKPRNRAWSKVSEQSDTHPRGKQFANKDYLEWCAMKPSGNPLKIRLFTHKNKKKTQCVPKIQEELTPNAHVWGRISHSCHPWAI